MFPQSDGSLHQLSEVRDTLVDRRHPLLIRVGDVDSGLLVQRNHPVQNVQGIEIDLLARLACGIDLVEFDLGRDAMKLTQYPF